MSNTAKVTIRFETKTQLAAIRRAAKLRDVSLNKYIIRTLSAQAGSELKTHLATEVLEESVSQ